MFCRHLPRCESVEYMKAVENGLTPLKIYSLINSHNECKSQKSLVSSRLDWVASKGNPV